MTRLLMISALAWALACGTVFGQASQETSAATSSPAAQNSVKLVAVIAALPAGAPWLSLRPGSLCVSRPIVKTWTGGRIPQDLPPYAAAFKKELEQAGYKVVTPGEDNLFDPGAGAADYEAAAVITDEKIDGCVMRATAFTNGAMSEAIAP
jgi:hypothetical protein